MVEKLFYYRTIEYVNSCPCGVTLNRTFRLVVWCSFVFAITVAACKNKRGSNYKSKGFIGHKRVLSSQRRNNPKGPTDQKVRFLVHFELGVKESSLLRSQCSIPWPLCIRGKKKWQIVRLLAFVHDEHNSTSWMVTPSGCDFIYSIVQLWSVN